MKEDLNIFFNKNWNKGREWNGSEQQFLDGDIISTKF